MTAATDSSLSGRTTSAWDRPLQFLAHGIVALLAVLLVSGLLLMTAYAPASTTAWGSVWYIQEHISCGWFFRGLHVVATDALILLISLYLACSFIRGLTGSSRQWQWWVSLGLLAFVLAFTLTGYLLPYDQRAYWGTVVRTNILGRVPFVGETLKDLLLAGDMPGTMALTRMFALHAAVLPILLALFWMAVRSRLRRCHAADASPTGSERTMEHGAVLHAVAPDHEEALRLKRTNVGCSTAIERALVHTVTLLVLISWVTFRHHYLGRSDLEAPADSTAVDYPARPEWWALPFYQFLKYFPTPAAETFAAVFVPVVLTALLVILPMLPAKWMAAGLHRWLLRGAAMVMVLAVGLAGQAAWHDWRADAPYRRARARADGESIRANELAKTNGIPPEGALVLLQDDPLTRGPKLFASHCASCHRVHGHNGLGEMPPEPATSSDLGGFGTPSWIRGLLADPMHTNYFGLMKNSEGEPAHTKMAEWTSEQRDTHSEPDARARLERDFDMVAAYLADEAVQPGRLADLDLSTSSESEFDVIRLGRRVFMQTCNECHSYQGERSGTFSAPDMHGYGSPAWLELMIAAPDHELRYRSKGRQRAQMPSFRDRLSPLEIRMLAEWLARSQTFTPSPDSSNPK